MTHRELAEKIVDDLFTNGAGKVAERLVLEMPNGSDGGGWGRVPMIDRVARTLDAHLSDPQEWTAVPSSILQDESKAEG